MRTFFNLLSDSKSAYAMPLLKNIRLKLAINAVFSMPVSPTSGYASYAGKNSSIYKKKTSSFHLHFVKNNFIKHYIAPGIYKTSPSGFLKTIYSKNIHGKHIFNFDEAARECSELLKTLLNFSQGVLFSSELLLKKIYGIYSFTIKIFYENQMDIIFSKHYFRRYTHMSKVSLLSNRIVEVEARLCEIVTLPATLDIPELRKRLNLSQRDFSKLMGVSVRTVESWESGRRNPSSSAKAILSVIDREVNLKSA